MGHGLGHNKTNGENWFRRFIANAPNWFRERQIFYRRDGIVSFYSISPRTQIIGSCLGLAFVSWVAFSTIYYISFDSVLKSKNRQISEARVAYRVAMKEFAGYNERLMKITRNLERSQSNLLVRFDPNAKIKTEQRSKKPRNRFTDLSRALVRASHRATSYEIKQLEREWRELAARNATLEHGLASIGNEVENILTENGIVVGERNRLRVRVKNLETSISSLRLREDSIVTRLTKGTNKSIGEASRVVAMTGLDINLLIARVARLEGRTVASGGLFLGSSKIEDPLLLKVAVLDGKIERWRNIQQVYRRLPMIAPLEYYRKSSSFGMRRDPLTKRWSQHNGMDMAYAMNSPVLATAAGKVVYAGYRGGLGWFIEINHGLGVRTRYAHLRKVLVKTGDMVDFRHKIGLLGSSGRSNGPHVHYEILVDGKPVDPKKFIKAGKYDFKS
ncbi:MAG: peptidoglycan DD-metalloendopeptidase family protein [Alphaproteobacteria bacterium]|nr:peptidoglycan DD-metalloendopeptidase family protein [Alphaproteobacteria bacterium]